LVTTTGVVIMTTKQRPPIGQTVANITTGGHHGVSGEEVF